MLKRPSLLLMFLLSMVCAHAVAVPASHKVIPIQHWKTKQGVGVYYVASTDVPMLDVRVVFAAGSIYDGAHPGLAAVTNEMLGKGTATQDANQIAAAFDRVGAQFSVSMNRDWAIVGLRTLVKPSYLHTAVKTFTQVLTRAQMPENALQRVKRHNIAAIHVGQEDPAAVASQAFYRVAYSHQIYAHEPLGTIHSVKKIQRAQVQAFYRRYYVAHNSDIIIVGQVNKRQAERIANKIAAQLRAGPAAKRLSLATQMKAPVLKHIPFPAQQTALVIGQVGITRKNPDYFPLIVGNYVLGGLPMRSILFTQVRDERGLAYYASSVFRPLRYRGPFMIALQTRANKTKAALALVQKTLKQYLKSGPTDAQLKAAKENLIGTFPLSLSTNKAILNVVTRIAFYHRPLDFLDHYCAKVQAVTSEQVKQAFDKVVHPNKMAVILVGPKSESAV